MCLDLYAAAPLQYRGLLIHIIDGDDSMLFRAVSGETVMDAPTWEALRAKIDEELNQ